MKNSHEPDYLLLVIVAVIVVFGLIALSSASNVIGHQQYNDSLFFLKKQFASVLVGILCFAVVYRIDYRVLKRLAFPMLLASIALLIAVYIPGIGVKLLGAQRWLQLGPIRFQPSEFVKLFFLIYLAQWLSDRGKDIYNRASGLWPFLVVLGIITVLIVQQPDIGTMTVIAIMSLASYFVAGAPMRDFAVISVLAVVGFSALIQLKPHAVARISVFINPQLDPQGIGYHIYQSVLTIASGGLLGLGLGHSRQKFSYLPEPAGDSIFAIISEELGFLFGVALIGLFVWLLVRGMRIARYAADDFGRILATGITAWFGFQALINIGALMRVFPLTGIPLPFVSYGGTAMLASFIALGILANISRYSKL